MFQIAHWLWIALRELLVSGPVALASVDWPPGNQRSISQTHRGSCSSDAWLSSPISEQFRREFFFFLWDRNGTHSMQTLFLFEKLSKKFSEKLTLSQLTSGGLSRTLDGNHYIGYIGKCVHLIVHCVVYVFFNLISTHCTHIWQLILLLHLCFHVITVYNKAMWHVKNLWWMEKKF